MNELFTRIKAEKWHMRLTCEPDYYYFCILWDSRSGKEGTGRSDIAPESAIMDAIREMSR